MRLTDAEMLSSEVDATARVHIKAYTQAMMPTHVKASGRVFPKEESLRHTRTWMLLQSRECQLEACANGPWPFLNLPPVTMREPIHNRKGAR